MIFAASSGRGALTPDDAGMILDELFETQNKSINLGLALKLPLHKVEAIQEQYQTPSDRLRQVIIEFLRQGDRPSWRIIVEALKNPSVDMISLATRVEEAHILNQVCLCVCMCEGAPTGCDIYKGYRLSIHLKTSFSY